MNPKFTIISRFQNLSLVVLSLLLLTLANCGKIEEAAKTVEPAAGTFTYIYTKTLKTECIECHTPTGAATLEKRVAIDFTTQALAYKTLTEGLVAATDTVLICPNVKLVASGSPSTSYLAGLLLTEYYKSNDFADVSGCAPDSVHTEKKNALSTVEKTSIADWITNGAKNN